MCVCMFLVGSKIGSLPNGPYPGGAWNLLYTKTVDTVILKMFL